MPMSESRARFAFCPIMDAMSGFRVALLVANVALFVLILVAVRQNHRRGQPGWPVALKFALAAALCGVVAQLATVA